MATVRVRRRGPASKYRIWARYDDPARWREWAPGVRALLADGPLRPGLEGEIHARLGVRVRFEVLDVDRPGGRWTWSLAAGPIHLRVEHEIWEGRAGMVITGPGPLPLACVPIARVALDRVLQN